MTTPRSSLRLMERLFEPVDVAWLVYFRQVFGLLMLVQVALYLSGGRLDNLYIDPEYHFTFLGFDWVRPWPSYGMYIHFVALGIAALGITIGFYYRVSVTIFFIGFTYLFLLDKARYLNHYYLICLVSFLLIFLPASAAHSIDASRRPATRRDTVPAWTLWLVRAQLAIVYSYAGIAKINADWLQGEPIRLWLANRRGRPIIGPILTQEWFVGLVCYGGLAFDLFIVPLLLWRRTRPFAIVWMVLFHLANAVIFGIGIFPWFALAVTLVFLEPSWSRRVLGLPPELPPGTPPATTPPPPTGRRRRWIVTAAGLYLSIQILVPLRHHVYPGNVAWTEEGHRFAWRMKLRTKVGRATFHVRDTASGKEWSVDPADYLSARQYRKMCGVPDMVLQFAHFLAAKFRADGYLDVEVRATVKTSLNGRRHQLLVDPKVDLAREPRSLLPATWILPLTEPL